MRRMRFFASRNAREILRDPISVGFGVTFPILLLLLLSFLNRHIPAEAHMTLFEPEQLAPGVSVFSLSFLALFSALLLSRDRSSALILRLYASPLTGRDFILGSAAHAPHGAGADACVPAGGHPARPAGVVAHSGLHGGQRAHRACESGARDAVRHAAAGKGRRWDVRSLADQCLGVCIA